ncbi:MAG: NAD(+)--dinitrogen-reductase ADP-D-ribosyltransferase [Burkholderiales bacterium]|nr:NAD(+)--dinitrogen-reductase ADP-D-ribosyltransferase [Burkholderiales bacterium]
MDTQDKGGSIAAPGSNLVGIPAGLLASASFNEFPIPLSIRGTREAHFRLFESLNQAANPVEARQCFLEYMSTVFASGKKHEGARRFRASYLQVLEDWGFDANGQAGAVLKGWVESRFGLFPTFHKAPIRRFNSPEWITYMAEKMSSRFNNNGILDQLDLLYEFCQWAMPRFFATGKRHLRLYRGSNDMNDRELVQNIDSRTAIVRLNNLSSFTMQRNIADEFGDIIIEAEVPTVKILYFSELLPHTLQGESEYMVIGGNYRIKMAYF